MACHEKHRYLKSKIEWSVSSPSDRRSVGELQRTWMTANLVTLDSSKIEFLLIWLKNQLAKIHNSSLDTSHSTRNLGFILPSLAKLHLSTKPVTVTFVNFAKSGLTLIRQLPVPLLPLSFTPSLIAVILSTINSLSINYPVFSRSRTLLLVLSTAVVKAPTSCHITPILRFLQWLRITESIEYKLLSLIYKVLKTTQPPYLHNLSSKYSLFIRRYTLARPPTSSSLKIILTVIASFVMLRLVCGTNSLYLFVNRILVPVPPFPTHLFFRPPLILPAKARDYVFTGVAWFGRVCVSVCDHDN